MFENIPMEVWIGFIAFLIGIGLCAGALFRKQVGWNINPVFAVVIGVVLVVFGGAYSIPQLMPAEPDSTGSINVNIPQSGDTTTDASYTVTATNGSDVAEPCEITIASDDESAQVLLYGNGEVTDSNTLNTTRAAVNFTFDPVPPSGSNADTLTTVYFETPYKMKHDGEYVLEENAGVYFANWTYAAGSDSESTDDYDGSMTMLLTETGWAEICYKFDSSNSSGSFSYELDTIGESTSWDITFHNADWSWSDTFTVNCVYMGDE